MGINIVAAIWGLAEATLFFLVPDIWLSIAGRKNLKVGLTACLYSLIGALIGGIALYYWGKFDLDTASHVVEKVPAVNPAMIARVHTELSTNGLLAVLAGPLSGTPYKIYAIQSAGTGIGPWPFLLISIPARLLRFAMVTIGCHYLIKCFRRIGCKVPSLRLLLIAWFIFYSFYFYMMPGT